MKSKIGIIGGGPAGCICAYYLHNDFEVTVFDFGSPLRTLLPTGGGRCNLAYSEYDFRELVKNYPRGDKFLYSVFSKFSTADTLEFFENMGIETYTQDDMRIFPVSNSAKDVRETFLNNLKKVTFKCEKALRVDKTENGFSIVTDNASFAFDKIVIASGGHSTFNIAKYLGHNIIEPKPALVGLKTRENLKDLAGVSIKNVSSCGFCDDFLFTHEGISGPLIYKISSIKARDKFPYNLTFNFIGVVDLQTKLNENPHKSIKNIIGELVPQRFANYSLEILKIDPDTKAHKIDGKTRDKILKILTDFTLNIHACAKDGEVVTSGGVDLKEINPKTMESRLLNGIYFAGEIMNIDGFCGGFNLQNCWSTGYAAAQGIIETKL